MKNNRKLSVCVLILELCLVSGAFFAGYMYMQKSFAVPTEIADYVQQVRTEREKAAESVILAETTTEPVVVMPSIERRDLYVLLGADGNLQTVVAGYLNAEREEAKLVTVPLDAYMNLPDTLYRTLSAEFPTIPQVFELGILPVYVGKERIGAVLGSIFESLYVCKFDQVWTLQAKDIHGWLKQDGGIMVLTEEAKQWLALPQLEKQVLQQLTILEQAEQVMGEALATGQSAGLRPYAEVIAILNGSDVTTELAAGKQETEHYSLNLERMSQQLSGLYTEQ